MIDELNGTQRYIVQGFEEAGHMIPEHLRDGLYNYLMKGRPGGHFLTAVLENDLMEAFKRGDDKSLAGLHDLMKFLYNYAPAISFGSPEKVTAWMKQGGAGGDK